MGTGEGRSQASLAQALLGTGLPAPGKKYLWHPHSQVCTHADTQTGTFTQTRTPDALPRTPKQILFLLNTPAHQNTNAHRYVHTPLRHTQQVIVPESTPAQRQAQLCPFPNAPGKREDIACERGGGERDRRRTGKVRGQESGGALTREQLGALRRDVGKGRQGEGRGEKAAAGRGAEGGRAGAVVGANFSCGSSGDSHVRGR